MAEQDIIQNLISRLGQSQADRSPAELGRHFVDVDERTPEILLAQTASLAKLIRYYPQPAAQEQSDWSAYFPTDEAEIKRLLARDDGKLTPHLGLFAAFLQLCRYPQQAINEITGKHLDFQFQRVLRFTPRPAQPDHAHLLLELAKGAAATAVTPQQSFSAGKDESGYELIYKSVRDVVVNHGQVAQLKSVFHSEDRLRFAPIANSADGLGSPLESDRPQWRAFGHPGLPTAQIGFAVAAPVLRMAEGARTLRIELRLSGLDGTRHTPSALAGAFEAHLTGPQGWFKAENLSAEVAGNRLALAASMDATSPAIVDYNALVHGHAFAAQAPIVQLLLNQDGVLRYRDLIGLTVSTIQIRVTVDGLTALNVENDFGKLNAKKSFQPFGPQPVAGSRLMIGSEEALSKRLSDLKIKLVWQGAPPNLAKWYENYQSRSRMSDGVSAHVVYRDRSGQTRQVTRTLIANAATAETTISIDGPPSGPAIPESKTDAQLFALSVADSSVLRQTGLRLALRQPLHYRPVVPAPAARSGFITLALAEDFLHADYRRETIANALVPPQTPKILNEPYTPTVQNIRLSYRAESDQVDVSETSLESFTNSDVQFFHVACFGQMREHAFARQQFTFLADKRVALLPEHSSEGEFLIGMTGVAAGDSVSLLLQAAEGSGDPDLVAPALRWSVLCDNYWRPLTESELTLDTTQGLRTSGIVALSLPAETTREHTVLPTGLVWLRATIATNSAAACQLMFAANNAVEVVRATEGLDSAKLANAVPAQNISKVKSPPAAIKGVRQPFASFGGRAPETDAMLSVRAAERLRHRNRCLSAWDFERLLLESFPAVERVKCIPHASETSWLAPGNVLLVVVPNLRNQNASDPLRPRVAAGTISEMTAVAQQHCGMQVRVRVKNPRYQRVKLAFQVRFQRGLSFHYYRAQLHEALVRMLSPWAYEATKPLQFGGRVYRSALLDFVEELPYVDFVSDFILLSPDSEAPHLDRASIQADTPDAILVSDVLHSITEFHED